MHTTIRPLFSKCNTKLPLFEEFTSKIEHFCVYNENAA
nr:MAG TPA: hypothetical protein [Caudoviricetes sp.]